MSYRNRQNRLQRTIRKHAVRKFYRNYCGRTPWVCLETPKRGCRRNNERELTLQEIKHMESYDINQY